jgi:hypothetical protein
MLFSAQVESGVDGGNVATTNSAAALLNAIAKLYNNNKRNAKQLSHNVRVRTLGRAVLRLGKPNRQLCASQTNNVTQGS